MGESAGGGSLGPQHLRAELRRFTGAYFGASGFCAAAATCLQVAALALASSSRLRDLFQPTTKWILLGLASASLVRWLADNYKRRADAILRRSEISDGFGTLIPQLELEEVREDASWFIEVFLRFQALDLTPYASSQQAGPIRIVENARETAWWSARLATGLRRWEYTWAACLAIACGAALFQIATDHSVGRQPADVSREVAEFAATLLVFVFAEGAFRRGGEFGAFARESHRIFDKAEQFLKNERHQSKDAIVAEALLLSFEYAQARNNAPRLSTLWYKHRKNRLNAAWDRANPKTAA